MTIWEKVLVNMEKGVKKVTDGAALFSERVRAEIAIARLRIRLDELRSGIGQQYQVIGRRVVLLQKGEDPPKTMELLMKEEEIVAALAEIAARERDISDLQIEIANEQAVFKQPERPQEGSE